MPEPKRGEVWRVDFNPTVGSEQSEIRPAIVLSADSMNESAERSIVVPLTKTQKNLPTWIRVEPPEGGLTKTSSILCDQIRCVSHHRFSERCGVVGPAVLLEIERVMKYLLGFD